MPDEEFTGKGIDPEIYEVCVIDLKGQKVQNEELVETLKLANEGLEKFKARLLLMEAEVADANENAVRWTSEKDKASRDCSELNSRLKRMEREKQTLENQLAESKVSYMGLEKALKEEREVKEQLKAELRGELKSQLGKETEMKKQVENQLEELKSSHTHLKKELQEAIELKEKLKEELILKPETPKVSQP